MSLTLIPVDPETGPDEPMLNHRLDLDELIAISMRVTRLVEQQAQVEVAAAVQFNEPAPDFTVAFDRMSRSVRRSIWMAHRLAQPAKAPAAEQAADRRVAARKQIIRAVEDSIERDAPADEAERLQAEFMERLDSLELDDEIGVRTDAEIIVDIRRDLGIADQPGGRVGKRRTPKDVALLCARAATRLPDVGPFVLPMPPRKWVYDNLLFARPEVAPPQLPGAGGCRGP